MGTETTQALNAKIQALENVIRVLARRVQYLETQQDVDEEDHSDPLHIDVSRYVAGELRDGAGLEACLAALPAVNVAGAIWREQQTQRSANSKLLRICEPQKPDQIHTLLSPQKAQACEESSVFLIDCTALPPLHHLGADALWREFIKAGFQLLLRGDLANGKVVDENGVLVTSFVSGCVIHLFDSMHKKRSITHKEAVNKVLRQAFAPYTPPVYNVAYDSIYEVYSTESTNEASTERIIDEFVKDKWIGLFLLWKENAPVPLTRSCVFSLEKSSKFLIGGSMTWLDTGEVVEVEGYVYCAASFNRRWFLLFFSVANPERVEAAMTLPGEAHPLTTLSGRSMEAPAFFTRIQSGKRGGGSSLQRQGVEQVLNFIRNGSKIRMPQYFLPRAARALHATQEIPCVQLSCEPGVSRHLTRISKHFFYFEESSAEPITLMRDNGRWHLYYLTGHYTAEGLYGIYTSVSEPDAPVVVSEVGATLSAPYQRCAACLIPSASRGRCASCGAEALRTVRSGGTSRREILNNPQAGLSSWNLWCCDQLAVTNFHIWVAQDGSTACLHPSTPLASISEWLHSPAASRLKGTSPLTHDDPTFTPAVTTDGTWGSQLVFALSPSLRLTLWTQSSKLCVRVHLRGIIEDSSGSCSDVVLTPKEMTVSVPPKARTLEPWMEELAEGLCAGIAAATEVLTATPSSSEESTTEDEMSDTESGEDEITDDLEVFVIEGDDDFEVFGGGDGRKGKSMFIEKAKETVSKLLYFLSQSNMSDQHNVRLLRSTLEASELIKRKEEAGVECEQEVKAAVARLVDITREKTRTTLLEGDAPQKAQGSGAGAAGREAGEEGAPVVPEEAAENVGKNPPTADAANPCIAAMHEANQLRRQRCLDVKERLQHLQDPAINYIMNGVLDVAQEDREAPEDVPWKAPLEASACPYLALSFASQFPPVDQ